MSSCVHLEEADFHILVVRCEQDSSCVGAKYEDQVGWQVSEVCREALSGLLFPLVESRMHRLQYMRGPQCRKALKWQSSSSLNISCVCPLNQAWNALIMPWKE